MATLIYADGEEKEVKPEDGSKFSLEELQQFVGGNIQVVPSYSILYNAGVMDEDNDQDVMLCNEEGLLHDLPLNITASVMSQDKIVGNVVLISSGEWD